MISVIFFSSFFFVPRYTVHERAVVFHVNFFLNAHYFVSGKCGGKKRTTNNLTPCFVSHFPVWVKLAIGTVVFWGYIARFWGFGAHTPPTQNHIPSQIVRHGTPQPYVDTS